MFPNINCAQELCTGRAGAFLERAENGTLCFGVVFFFYFKEILQSYQANFVAVFALWGVQDGFKDVALGDVV